MEHDRMPDLSTVRDPESRLLVEKAYAFLDSCTVCPRECGINRKEGELGTCRTGVLPKISAYNLHFGEEPAISGTRGSGTVFFASCNLSCDFCQNFPISQMDYGRPVTPERLSRIYLELEARGAHNINLVTPSHIVPPVLHSLVLAREAGLGIPVVYNSNGYDSVSMLRLLEGWIDVYLPDMKYSSDLWARRISKADGYVFHNRSAVAEMFRQVGPLRLDEEGIAQKGLLIRHLIMPNELGGWENSARFIRHELGESVAVSLMAQYFPTNRARSRPLISRRITEEEYERALDVLFAENLMEGYVQEYDARWEDTSAPAPRPSDSLSEQESRSA
ncbi:radical activating enzyme [Leptospirillum ferriphilum]|jgi:putative pyruvate formate lyase activating enzyme|uniref:Radical activating enzyme n=3 Tax=Leptospirillum TaxID=179 RepID=A0A094W781_9BACT|nr:radical SAM protein [Leptospirillum ferriphilum]AFS54108.1 putative radical SAM family protein [Leptospirillum ferriphilum ML-04]EDZ38061.1 MAG: Putative radical SAM family protein [Leptospirillum sp. Group II '5-way CG']KGA93348.1 radical activating enzyme [Leptospirillum ferriphilum]